MTNSVLRGVFLTDASLRREFLALLQRSTGKAFVAVPARPSPRSDIAQLQIVTAGGRPNRSI